MNHLLRILAFFCVALPVFAEGRWVMKYFFDEDKASFVINDIAFSSPKRGVAIGVIAEKGERPKPMSVITSDGGEHWTQIPLKEIGSSLFFLDESHGWMVAEQGVWFTDEAGRSWKKLAKQKGLNHIYFLTPEHGFAVGRPKLLLETTDGGKVWNKVAAADSPATTPQYTFYNWITFLDASHGLIVGHSQPPKISSSRLPTWMTPDEPERETPSVTILLETNDAGKTWSSKTVSLFGLITQVRMGGGRTVALFEFRNQFRYPSDLVRMDKGAGEKRSVLARKDRLVTNVVLFPNGHGVAAGIEPAAPNAHLPVPGRVKVATSADLNTWLELPVDYRALANRVSLAAPDENHMWIATDTGMILQWKND